MDEVDKENIMNKLTMNAVVLLLSLLSAVSLFAESAQEELEFYLQDGNWHVDNITSESSFPPYVPHRYRNSLPQFEGFIARHAWTTNQFIEGLICAMTNNITDEKWVMREKQRIAGVAAWKLSEIDNPAVTNFFRQFNDSDDTCKLKGKTIPSMFHRTNLEPEVMAYMRSLCVRTNVYYKVEFDVVYDMFETLSTMPKDLKPAVTNRVAKYIFFAIRHETDTQGWHDRELARFIPAYSNSFQRLSLMRYVAGSTTNAYQRTYAEGVVQRLESLPTNQLNDISWIADDVNNGGN